MSRNVKSEEKSSEKKIVAIDITFVDRSHAIYTAPGDQWITTYQNYLLVLHGKGRIYIPWTIIFKAQEYEVIEIESKSEREREKTR